MKTITIMTMIDVVGALASNSLTNNIYMIDDNKLNGSQDLGTGVLKTKVEQGDNLLWVVLSIEPEAFGTITGIIIDPDYCEPEQQYYVGSDVAYWQGTVKKDLQSVPYDLKIRIGTRDEELTTPEAPSLIGNPS